MTNLKILKKIFYSRGFTAKRIPQYDFDRLDGFLDYLMEIHLFPVIELMGNIFPKNDFHDTRYMWKDFTFQLTSHYLSMHTLYYQSMRQSARSRVWITVNVLKLMETVLKLMELFSQIRTMDVVKFPLRAMERARSWNLQYFELQFVRYWKIRFKIKYSTAAKC